MTTSDELGKSDVFVKLVAMLFPLAEEAARPGMMVGAFEGGLLGILLCAGNHVVGQFLSLRETTSVRRSIIQTTVAMARPPSVEPALMLLSSSGGLIPHVLRRMPRDSAPLRFSKEASEMLFDAGIASGINNQRKFCNHINRELAQLTAPRQILLSMETWNHVVLSWAWTRRVRLRGDRKACTKKRREQFAACWRKQRPLIIYTINEDRRMTNEFAPIVDGRLACCDRLSPMPQAYRVSKKSSPLQVCVSPTKLRTIFNAVPRIEQSAGF